MRSIVATGDTRGVARFVLLHGAWLGGWYWAPLARELEARGHEMWAPDLPCEEVGVTVSPSTRR